MPWGFEEGHEYSRREHIHQRYGGQQQDGIITPSAHRVIFAISDENGAAFGYHDRFHEDGLVEYFGRGQTGDMELTHGNLAIDRHTIDGEDLLLFRTYPYGSIRFHGEMVCRGWHYEQAPGRDGVMRQAIVFELLPIEKVTHALEDLPIAPAAGREFEALRRRAYQAGEVGRPDRQAPRTIYERSRDVRDYVLARANGVCEGCGEPAPFLRPNGTPYLEPHHIHRRSDGGPDHPRFVIALCPTCHRRVHFGEDGPVQNAAFLADMARIEPGARR